MHKARLAKMVIRQEPKDQYPLSTIKEVEVKLEDGGEAMVNEEVGVLT